MPGVPLKSVHWGGACWERVSFAPPSTSIRNFDFADGDLGIASLELLLEFASRGSAPAIQPLLRRPTGRFGPITSKTAVSLHARSGRISGFNLDVAQVKPGLLVQAHPDGWACN